MSGSGYIGKSKVTIDRDAGIVTKQYIIPETGKGGNFSSSADPILSMKSFGRSPSHYFYKESKALEVLSNIPDDKRLSPKLLGVKEETLTIQMELIDEKTFLEVGIEALESGKGPVYAMREIPHAVAKIHSQLQEHQEDLVKNVRWKKGGAYKQGLRVRSLEEEQSRTWNYLRTIVYSLSPDLVELRRKAEEEAQQEKVSLTERRRSIDSEIKEYLHHQGINPKTFIEEIVNRDCQILYGVSNPRVAEERLLKEQKLVVVHGDMGPQHVFTDGRYMDLDEARLSVKEVDLVSALYSTITSPLDTPERELELIELAFEYLRDRLKREPSAEERAALLARVVECRLNESKRLFAVDCKASLAQLKEFTKGLHIYKNVEKGDLRKAVLEETFMKGLQHFLQFYTSGEGFRALSSTKDSQLVYDQLSAVQYFFMKTRIFEGLSDLRILTRLERLLGTPEVSESQKA